MKELGREDKFGKFLMNQSSEDNINSIFNNNISLSDDNKNKKNKNFKFVVKNKNSYNINMSSDNNIDNKNFILKKNSKINKSELVLKEENSLFNFKVENSTQDYNNEQKYISQLNNTNNIIDNYDDENSSKNQDEDGENFKIGRWQPDEHQRFIEAILKYGNEWKKVQQYVGSRSSSQARSHAQKFFVKIKRTNLYDLDIDLNKGSIKSLQEVANQMNTDQYLNTIKKLNNIAFERKSNHNNNPRIKTKSNEDLNELSLMNSSFTQPNPQGFYELNCNVENLKLEINKNNDNLILKKEISNQNSINNTPSSSGNKSKKQKKSRIIPLINNQNINTTTNNYNINFSNVNRKNINLPGNIKILSKKEETNSNSNNVIENKKIIINNNINNYNISFNHNNLSHRKRSRIDSIDNMFSTDNNFNSKMEMEEDFHNYFLDYFKNEKFEKNELNLNEDLNQTYPLSFNIDNFFVNQESKKQNGNNLS